MWMFCSRRANKKLTNYTNEPWDLHIMIMEPRFWTYLQWIVHHKNIQELSLEMYKIKYDLCESCSIVLFSAVNDNYNLHSQSDFRVPGINTVFYGANSISYSGSVIWNSLPNDLKDICDFDLFKTTIRKQKLVHCSCRLYKNYLDGLGVITVSS